MNASLTFYETIINQKTLIYQIHLYKFEASLSNYHNRLIRYYVQPQ